jgi:hypothetical protein
MYTNDQSTLSRRSELAEFVASAAGVCAIPIVAQKPLWKRLHAALLRSDPLAVPSRKVRRGGLVRLVWACKTGVFSFGLPQAWKAAGESS